MPLTCSGISVIKPGHARSDVIGLRDLEPRYLPRLHRVDITPYRRPAASLEFMRHHLPFGETWSLFHRAKFLHALRPGFVQKHFRHLLTFGECDPTYIPILLDLRWCPQSHCQRMSNRQTPDIGFFERPIADRSKAKFSELSMSVLVRAVAQYGVGCAAPLRGDGF